MWAHQNINADWGFAWSRSSSAYWLLALICTTTCKRTPRPLCPAGTATSSLVWREAPVQFLCVHLEWRAAFEEWATFTCFARVFTCRTRLFSALKEKKQACISNYTPSECTAASLTPLGPVQGVKSVTVDTSTPVRRRCVLAWRGSPVRDRVSAFILLCSASIEVDSCFQTFICHIACQHRFFSIHSTLHRLIYTKTTTDTPC